MLREKQNLTSRKSDSPVLLRLPDLMRYVCLSKATIYKLMKTNDFPKPIRLTERAVAWRKNDVDSWIEACPTSDVVIENE